MACPVTRSHVVRGLTSSPRRTHPNHTPVHLTATPNVSSTFMLSSWRIPPSPCGPAHGADDAPRSEQQETKSTRRQNCRWNNKIRPRKAWLRQCVGGNTNQPNPRRDALDVILAVGLHLRVLTSSRSNAFRNRRAQSQIKAEPFTEARCYRQVVVAQ